MKLLWITGRRFGHECSQTTQLALMDELVNIGWEIHTICPADSILQERKDIEFELVGGVHKRGLRGPLYNKAINRVLGDILKKFSPDIVICDWRCVNGAFKTLKGNIIPWVLMDRGGPADSGVLVMLQKIAYRIAWRKAVVSASNAFMVSESHVNRNSRLFSNSFQMTVVPAAVMPERFTKSTECKDKIRLFYHGKMDRNRNIIECFNLASRCISEGIECTLTMVGDGTALKQLKSLSTKYPWLCVMGQRKQEEIPALLAKADIGLLPMGRTVNWSLASPIKLFEYAAAGMMILGTDLKAHKVFGMQQWVRLVPANDFSVAGAMAVQEFVDKKEFYRVWADDARRIVTEHHTWRKSAEIIDSKLKNIIANR